MENLEMNLLDVFLYPSATEVLMKHPDDEIMVRMRAVDLIYIKKLAEDNSHGKVQ